MDEDAMDKQSPPQKDRFKAARKRCVQLLRSC
jgi:hypothetical protein